MMSDFFDEIPSMLQHYRFKRRMMNNLNQMGAPSISNILTTISRQGNIADKTGTTMLEDAIKSQDINYINEVQDTLRTKVMDMAPVPYKPLIEAQANTLDLYKDKFTADEEFDNRMHIMRDKLDGLPLADVTGDLPELLGEFNEYRNNENKFWSKEQISSLENLKTDITNKVTFSMLLKEYDADPSTPEMDRPDEYRYPTEQFEYNQAERISRAYQFDPAGGIGEMKKLYGTQQRLENQDYLNQLRTQKAIDDANAKSAERIQELLEKTQEVTEDDKNRHVLELRNITLETIKYRAENDPDAVFDDIVQEEISKTIGGPIFRPYVLQDGSVKDPILSQDDFFQSLHGVVPYGLQAEKNKIPDDTNAGYGTEIERLKTEHTRRVENKKNADFLTLQLSSAKGQLEAAQKIMPNDYEKDNILGLMDLTDAMLGTSQKDRPNIDAKGAIQDINRSILKILREEGGSWTDAWAVGFMSPGDFYDDENIDALDSDARKSLDALYIDAKDVMTSQWKYNPWGSETEVTNSFIALVNARQHLYNLIDAGLLNQKMNDYTGETQSAFGKAVSTK